MFLAVIRARGVAAPLNPAYTSRDGNGEFPVGFWLPIPVPATKKLPRGDPHEHLRGAFLPHPRYPRG
jgi:hypothetical protein